MMHGLIANIWNFWLPPQASPMAREVDWVQWFAMFFSIFFFLLVTTLIIVFALVYRYRAKDDVDGKPQKEHVLSAGHSTALEITWTLVPVVLCVLMFYYGFQGFMNMSVAPQNSYDINVTGRMWSWAFTYPNGVVDSDLHIPINQPVRLILASDDVIHSLYIPAFRVKKDVVPGRYNHFWVEGDKLGTYELFCTQYCGLNHTEMHGKVVVQSRADFEQWLEENANWEGRMSPVEAGKMFYTKMGCNQCHSTDGSVLVGPSWKNLYGHKVTFNDGTSQTADDNYIRQSIMDPGAHIVKGYQNVMPSFAGTLKDRDIGAIIAYIKTLSESYKGDQLSTPATEPGTNAKNESANPKQ